MWSANVTAVSKAHSWRHVAGSDVVAAYRQYVFAGAKLGECASAHRDEHHCWRVTSLHRPIQSQRPYSRTTSMAKLASAAATAPDNAFEGAKYAKELHAACKAVRLASKLCQLVQQQLSDSEKADKADDSPVTIADYGAQAVVAWALSRASPGSKISMVAEEDSKDLRDDNGHAMVTRITGLINSVITTAGEGAEPLSEDQVLALIDLGSSPGGAVGSHWVLDPIDGTRGFVGMRQYAVCLGLIQDGEVVVGVLGCPNLPQGQVTDDDGGAGAAGRSDTAGVGCLFLAHRGRGAYASSLWDDSSPLERIHVNDVSDVSQARFMESYESRHSDHSFTAAVARQAGVTMTPLRMDSQVKYGLLSRGDASIFMRFPPASYREKIWDHCAGFVIVEEAGGKVTDASGARLDFSRGRWLDLDRGIIAAPPTVHTAILNAVEQVTSSQASL